MNTNDRYIKNDDGKVLYYDGLSGKAFPYRWNRAGGYWLRCTGKYTLKYIEQMKRMGLVKFVWSYSEIIY